MLSMRRVVRSFATATAMRVAGAVISFAFFVFLARSWGSQRLGEFATIYALFLLLQLMPLLGLHVALIRDVAQQPESACRTVSNAALFGLLVSIVLGVGLGLAGTGAYPPQMQRSVWLVGAALIPSALIAVAESFLIAKERLDIVATVNVGETVLRTALWVALVLAGYGLTALCVALLAGRLVAVAAYYTRGELPSSLRAGECSRSALTHLAALCPPFLGSAVFAAGINRLDFVMLSKLGSVSQVGMYAAPYKIYEVALMLPSILTVVLFPTFSRLSPRADDQLAQVTRHVCRFCVTVGLPLAVALAFTADPLVRVLFGPTYAPAAIVLVCLAFVPVTATVDQTLAMVMLAGGRQKLDMTVIGVSCGFYAVALAVLIPRFGYLGAAIATAATALVQPALRYQLVRGTMAPVLRLHDLLVAPVFAAVLMAAATAGLRMLSLGVALVVGAAVYVGALALLRAVTPDDLGALRAAVARG